MSDIPILLQSDLSGLSLNDFVVETRRVAEKQETHIAFQDDVPEYVTKAPQMMANAEGLSTLGDAAATGDRGKKAEQDTLRAKIQRAHSYNAFHITALSLHRNDPGILENSGYPMKEKGGPKPVVKLLDLVPEVFAKHLVEVSGGIIIMVKRAKDKATVQLQWTDQDPNVEASWSGEPTMYNKSRIEMRGFVPASTIYIRARYHEDGASGRWSSYVSIIIL